MDVNEHAKRAAHLLRARLRDPNFNGELSISDEDQDILKALWDAAAERLNAGDFEYVRNEIQDLRAKGQELSEELVRLQNVEQALTRETRRDYRRVEEARRFSRVRAKALLVQTRLIILRQALDLAQQTGHVELSGETDSAAFDDFKRLWVHSWGLQHDHDACFVRASELLAHRPAWDLKDAWVQIEKEARNPNDEAVPYHVSWAQFKDQFHKSKKYGVKKSRAGEPPPLDVPIL